MSGRYWTSACLLVLAGCSRGEPPPPGPGAGATTPVPRREQPEGHRALLALLREIEARTPEENLFLGDRLLRDLQAELGALPAGSGPAKIWDLERRIGAEELRLGRNAEALAATSRAVALLPEVRGQIPVVEEKNTIFNLALAYLRLAEATNCVGHHHADSCIFPIQGGGIHVDPEPSRKAIAVLSELLGRWPDHLQSRWLLN